MGNKKINYGAESIQLVENLKAVRKRPGMYIGSTGAAGLHHLLWEIVDNAVDEYLAGECKLIKISIEEDNSCIIEDDGRGIPTGMHSTGISAVELIFTKLHAGGKFGGTEAGYKVSGGLHGVGSSVVNALSNFVYVDIQRDGSHYSIKFEQGGELVQPLKKVGSSNKHGTRVHFKPDPTIFSHTVYD
jgi:DNA gyrase/topoisomerase IV subunit B